MESGADAIKLEGESKRVGLRALVECEIPVMGHLSLIPQSVDAMGGSKVQGLKADDALRVLDVPIVCRRVAASLWSWKASRPS